MTKIERQMIGAMIVFCGGIGASVAIIKHEIKDSGGIKQIIIDAGKDIKDIANEINKDT